CVAPWPSHSPRDGTGSHRVANAMAKVPRSFHAAAQRPLKLASRDTFLAAAKQMDGLEPEPQGKVAVLKDGADPHGEGLATGVALEQPGAGRFASKPSYLAGISILAMRTDGS